MANAPKKSAVPPKVSAAAPVEGRRCDGQRGPAERSQTRRRASRGDSTELPQRA